MGDKEYLAPLELLGIQDADNRIRVRIATDRGQVTQYLLQYETFIGGVWRPVVQ